MTKLNNKAEVFIKTLEFILRKATGLDAQFHLENNVDGSLTIRNDEPGFALTRKDSDPVLFLHIVYVVVLDSHNEHLKIKNSSIRLQVKVKEDRKANPLVRVEYQSRRTISPAHMHIHANSPELTWLYGITDNYAPNLHDLHFPVGGHHFRPTLEEFLFFLNDEKLFTDWQDDWKQHLNATYNNWKSTQAKSVVRNYRKEAIEELEDLGYVITSSDDKQNCDQG